MAARFAIDAGRTGSVLIVRPSALGDVCRSVPVLVSLKRALPGARVDWLVQDTFRAAIEHHPDLGRAVPFPRGAFRKLWQRECASRAGAFLRDLRGSRYDMVVDCQGLARSGFIAWWTGAPVRIGHTDAGEFGWIGVNRRVDADSAGGGGAGGRGGGALHTVDRMLALVEAAGIEPVRDMRLYTGEAERQFVRAEVSGRIGRYVAVAPTSRWPGKVWAMDRHAELIRRLLADPAMGLDGAVITGSASEAGSCAELLERCGNDPRVVSLVGRTSVGQLMAVIEGASLVVGSDSAAIHMAVGFGRPLVGLYGPTRVDRVGPYLRSHHVVQRVMPGDRLEHKDEAAGRTLMARIQVEDVLEVVYEQMRARRRTGGVPAGQGDAADQQPPKYAVR